MSDTPITDQFIARHPFPFHRGAFVKKLQELECELAEARRGRDKYFNLYSETAINYDSIKSDLAHVSAEAAVLRDKLEQAKHLALNIYHGTAQEYRERAATLVGNLNEFLISTNAGRNFVRLDDSNAILARADAENKRLRNVLKDLCREIEELYFHTSWQRESKASIAARAELQRTEKQK